MSRNICWGLPSPVSNEYLDYQKLSKLCSPILFEGEEDITEAVNGGVL